MPRAMGRSRAFILLSAALAVTAAAATPARPAAKGCGPRGYSYAGLQSPRNAFGVAGTLSATASPLVQRGHVAGWVGVGAPGEGPQGTDEWLQVGLNTIAGNSAKLYYEIARPTGIKYVELASDVPPGRSYHVAVLETARHANTWRVWVDGRPASRPIWLPQSHGRLTPMALAESWDDGAPACNRYAYSFGAVSLAGRPGGEWSRAAQGRRAGAAGPRLASRPRPQRVRGRHRSSAATPRRPAAVGGACAQRRRRARGGARSAQASRALTPQRRARRNCGALERILDDTEGAAAHSGVERPLRRRTRPTAISTPPRATGRTSENPVNGRPLPWLLPWLLPCVSAGCAPAGCPLRLTVHRSTVRLPPCPATTSPRLRSPSRAWPGWPAA